MADTLDVLTLAEAKTALGIAAATWDTVLAQYVTAVSRQLDKLCGPIVARTVTTEPHDGGGYTIRLHRRPVYTITTVTEYAQTTGTTLTAETNATKTASNYLHDGTLTTVVSGTLRRRASGSDLRFADGRRNIDVTYDAGRAATTAAADAKFKNAASMVLRSIWVGEQAMGSETTGAVPEGVLSVLYGPPMLNKVSAMLTGEILDGVLSG